MLGSAEATPLNSSRVDRETKPPSTLPQDGAERTGREWDGQLLNGMSPEEWVGNDFDDNNNKSTQPQTILCHQFPFFLSSIFSHLTPLCRPNVNFLGTVIFLIVFFI
ncbi:hypothetical protein DMENIID0001_136530 [Sergentomyia squamirostris]